jgi:hypothetical protein
MHNTILHGLDMADIVCGVVGRYVPGFREVVILVKGILARIRNLVSKITGFIPKSCYFKSKCYENVTKSFAHARYEMDRKGFLYLADEMLKRSNAKGIKVVFWDDTGRYKVKIRKDGRKVR